MTLRPAKTRERARALRALASGERVRSDGARGERLRRAEQARLHRAKRRGREE